MSFQEKSWDWKFLNSSLIGFQYLGGRLLLLQHNHRNKKCGEVEVISGVGTTFTHQNTHPPICTCALTLPTLVQAALLPMLLIRERASEKGANSVL